MAPGAPDAMMITPPRQVRTTNQSPNPARVTGCKVEQSTNFREALFGGVCLLADPSRKLLVGGERRANEPRKLHLLRYAGTSQRRHALASVAVDDVLGNSFIDSTLRVAKFPLQATRRRRPILKSSALACGRLMSRFSVFPGSHHKWLALRGISGRFMRWWSALTVSNPSRQDEQQKGATQQSDSDKCKQAHVVNRRQRFVGTIRPSESSPTSIHATEDPLRKS